MGQTNSYGMGQNCTLQLVSEFPIGKVVKEQQSGIMHFLKEYSYNSQQTFQHAFIKFSRKLTQKHENILNLQKTNTKVQNTFCSTFYKIVLVFQYIDHTLKDQIQMRNKQNRKFQQKQIWSILFHCTLALAHLRRNQSFQHSAIRPQDIRLSSQGIIKILPNQMVGINGDHDQNEATTKILAMTIISCIMMKHISNQSNQFLQAVIQKLSCSGQLKQLLNIMVTQKQSFQKVQQYLFKLAQDDSDSILSGVSTPVIRSHQKPSKQSRKIMDSFQNVEVDIKIKQPQMSGMLPTDRVDQNDTVVQFQTLQTQNPDQNDHLEQNQNEQNSQTPLTQKYVSQKFNINASNQKQKQTLHKLKEEKETVRIFTNKKQNIVQNKTNIGQQQQMTISNDKQNIYTDPKLLDWIKKDFQMLKENSRIANFGQFSQNVQLNKQNNSTIALNTGNNGSQISLNSTNNGCQRGNQNQSLNSFNNTKNGQKDNQCFKRSSVSNIEQKKQLKITKEQQCFGNILDQEASFKKSKSHKKVIKQTQIQICKRNLNNQPIQGQTAMLSNKSKNTIQQKNNQIKKSNQSIVNKPTVNYVHQNSSTKPQPNNKYNAYNLQQIDTIKNQSSNLNKPKYDKNNPQVPKLEYVSQTYQKGKYQGQKLNDLRHGHGTFLYNEGGRYVGQWKQNKMEGKGILYYPNNTIAYQGNWQNDQLHGFGTLFNQQVEELHGPFDYRDWTDVEDYWVKYEGIFKFDNKQGNGKLFLSNGEIFEGSFKQDMVNGQGTLSRRDGSRVRGHWRDNKLIRMF